MNKPSTNASLLACLVFIISITIGTAITLKLTNWHTALNYLCFTSIISILAFIFQLIKYKSGKENLTDQLFYLGSLSFGMVWFMLSLFMPIFWMGNISFPEKALLGFISIILLVSNFFLGANEIRKKWKGRGCAEFKKEYDKSGMSADWEKILLKMDFTLAIHIPGIPKNLNDIISILLVVFMIIGFNLRYSMPSLSIFAWGIPSVVFAGCFVQLIGSYFSQRKIVQDIELENSAKIPAAGSKK
jgi:hypothetical protein